MVLLNSDRDNSKDLEEFKSVSYSAHWVDYQAVSFEVVSDRLYQI